MCAALKCHCCRKWGPFWPTRAPTSGSSGGSASNRPTRAEKCPPPQAMINYAPARAARICVVLCCVLCPLGSVGPVGVLLLLLLLAALLFGGPKQTTAPASSWRPVGHCVAQWGPHWLSAGQWGQTHNIVWPALVLESIIFARRPPTASAAATCS